MINEPFDEDLLTDLMEKFTPNKRLNFFNEIYVFLSAIFEQPNYSIEEFNRLLEKLRIFEYLITADKLQITEDENKMILSLKEIIGNILMMDEYKHSNLLELIKMNTVFNELMKNFKG